MATKALDFIGAGFGWGAQERATEEGAQIVWEEGLRNRLKEKGYAASWQSLVSEKRQANHDVPVGPEVLPLLKSFINSLSTTVLKSLEADSLPFILGGDHSIAVATWSALFSHAKNSLTPNPSLGLLWIDAHLDAHTPETTLSKAYHGMPLAALLGLGEESLVNHLEAQAKIQPENLVLLGVRSWEKEEYDLLKAKGVRLYKMEEIQDRGFKICFDESVSYLEKNTDAYGLSFDLDAFDPLVAPGVGSPETGGLKRDEVFPALRSLAHRPQLKVFEIVEFNPEKDINNITKDLLIDLILCLLENKKTL